MTCHLEKQQQEQTVISFFENNKGIQLSYELKEHDIFYLFLKEQGFLNVEGIWFTFDKVKTEDIVSNFTGKGNFNFKSKFYLEGDLCFEINSDDHLEEKSVSLKNLQFDLEANKHILSENIEDRCMRISNITFDRNN